MLEHLALEAFTPRRAAAHTREGGTQSLLHHPRSFGSFPVETPRARPRRARQSVSGKKLLVQKMNWLSIGVRVSGRRDSSGSIQKERHSASRRHRGSTRSQFPRAKHHASLAQARHLDLAAIIARAGQRGQSGLKPSKVPSNLQRPLTALPRGYLGHCIS